VFEIEKYKCADKFLDGVNEVECRWNFIEDNSPLVAILQLSLREGILGLDVYGLGVWQNEPTTTKLFLPPEGPKDCFNIHLNACRKSRGGLMSLLVDVL
jgi:hypothetical protein